MSDFGLTPLGFNTKRLADIKQDLENAMIAQFGDINIDPQSVFGQLIGVLAKQYADIWENMADVYFSEYPNSAEGVALDNVVQLNGITRLPAQQTAVTAICGGNESTLISSGSLAKIPNSNNIFSNPLSGVISRNSAYSVSVEVEALAAQVYTVLLNNIAYSFSLPKITFTGDFVWGNSIVVTLNGVQLSAVPYTNATSVIDFDINFVASNSIVATVNGTPLGAVGFSVNQATTIAALATQIGLAPGVSSSTVTATRQITVVFSAPGNNTVNSVITTAGATQPVATIVDDETTLDAIATEIETSSAVLSATPAGSIISIVPNVGFYVLINFIQITGGVSQPTYAITFALPGSVNQVSQYLVGILNAGTPDWEAVDLMGSFSITSTDADVPFSASVQPNLTIIAQSSPIAFLCQDFGPVACPANSLTEIVTPIAGWSSVNNPKAGVTGRLIETDSELRLRRADSIRLLGNTTVEAIRARLLQEVPGVTSALVFENATIFQAEIDIVFSSALVASNQITIEMNSRILPTITFATSNAATMGQLALLLEAQPEIASCVVGGMSNNTLEINMNVFQEVIIDDVTIIGGASQADHIIKGGRTPKSFEAVVEGGADADIAEEIWLSKAAGIATFGNTQFDITDSQGGTQAIFFSRPTPIYIWVQVALTLYSEETFPVNGTELVAQAILDYGNELGIGIDVLLQRVLCQIFTVPGVASGVMQIAATNGPNDNPSFGVLDISIEENEISVWSLARITVTV